MNKPQPCSRPLTGALRSVALGCRHRAGETIECHRRAQLRLPAVAPVNVERHALIRCAGQTQVNSPPPDDFFSRSIEKLVHSSEIECLRLMSTAFSTGTALSARAA